MVQTESPALVEGLSLHSDLKILHLIFSCLVGNKTFGFDESTYHTCPDQEHKQLTKQATHRTHKNSTVNGVLLLPLWRIGHSPTLKATRKSEDISTKEEDGNSLV